jgi:hypothetical protein
MTDQDLLDAFEVFYRGMPDFKPGAASEEMLIRVDGAYKHRTTLTAYILFSEGWKAAKAE